jgi:hypothetical protein
MWHVNVRGKQIGPISLEQLKHLATSRQLTPSDLVWTEGMPDWQQAASVQGLFGTPPPVRSVPGLPRRSGDSKRTYDTDSSNTPTSGPIKRLEIPINKKQLLRDTNNMVLFFGFMSVFAFLGGALTDGLLNITGIGALLFGIMTVGLLLQRKQLHSIKYSIVNDVLHITTSQSTARVPLSTITAVTISQGGGLSNLTVVAGSIYVLRGVTSPETAANALLSKTNPVGSTGH